MVCYGVSIVQQFFISLIYMLFDTLKSLGERVKGQGKKSKTRIVFSGDLGATYSPLLAAPRSPYRSDLLVLESTYGDRLHQGRRDRRKSD